MSKYVVDGASLKCILGSAPGNLTVTPGRTVSCGGKLKANISDSKPMVNIKPFGTCAKMSPPIPCTPIIPGPWINGKTNVMVQGMPALLEDAMVICACGGGVIKIQKDGQ